MASAGTVALKALVHGIAEIRQFEKDYDIWQEAVASMVPDEDHPYCRALPGYDHAINSHGALLRDWEFIALVAFLDAYIEDSLLAVFRAQPLVLASSRKITYEEVLKNRDVLIEHLAQREVASLMYESHDDILKFFEMRLSITVPDNVQQNLNRLKSVRNCLVHNRRKLHQKYAGHFPALKVGEDLAAYVDVPDASAMVLAFAEFLDMRLIEKYEIPIQQATPCDDS